MRCCVAALWVSALTTLAMAASDDAHRDVTPAQTENEAEMPEEEKRAWTNLHGGGGWGKRGWQDLNSAWGKRGWQDLNSAWGKRGWEDLNSAWGKRGWEDLNSAWGKRGWQDLNSGWGKRGWEDLNSAWGKRGWQDLNSAWGKRGWEDLNSAWGKRGWQDLNGGWGKRGWQDMSGAWGKRAGYRQYALYPKREEYKWLRFRGAPFHKRSDPTTAQDYEDFESNVDHMIPVQQVEIHDTMMPAPEKKSSRAAVYGAYGKRPMRPSPIGYYLKREPSWTNLRGIWGKRAAQSEDIVDLDQDSSASASKDEA